MTSPLMSAVCALTGLAMTFGAAGCTGDRAAARISNSAAPRAIAPDYICPAELPFDSATGLVPPAGSRTATEAEFRQADLTGFTGCEWKMRPPRSFSSSDRAEVRKTQNSLADRLGEPIPHDLILEGQMYVFLSSDGTTYFAGSAMHYGPGDVIEVIYALD